MSPSSMQQLAHFSMHNPRQPILDYARSHGVAFAINPLDYVDLASVSSEIPPSTQTQRRFEAYTSSLGESIEQDLQAEKLDINKPDARFLATIVQEARVEHVPCINWDSILPTSQQLERLRVKLDPPLLKADSELDLSSLRRRGFLNLNEINIPVKSPRTEYLSNAPDITAEIKRERLECTKESLRLIQDARKSGNPSLREVEDLSCSWLGRGLQKALTEPSEHASPLLPFNFTDESPSPTPKCLPSPESSLPSEKHRRDATTKIPVLHYPNPRERIWLLGSSDIDDMSPASSQFGAERRSGRLDEGNAVGASQPLASVEVPIDDSEREDGSQADMNGDVAPDTAGSRAGNRDIAQAAREQEHQAFSPMEESNRDHAECSADREHESTSGAHNRSTAEQNDSLPVESVEGGNTSPNFPVRESQENDALPSAVSIEEDSAREELDAINPRTTPRAEAACSDESTDLKRKRESPSASPGKQAKPEEDSPTAPARTAHTSRPFALGSLDSFMETRGITRRRVEKSPYFGDDEGENAGGRLSEDISVDEETPEEPIPSLSEQVPRGPQSKDPPVLFFSSALLKSHVQLVKYLETKDDPPTLIYRDYGPPAAQRAESKSDADASPAQETPLEADIIISPTTGITLTTSQAITQVYLPGHTPNAKVAGITGLDSPIRERIFLLAPRYEQLYIFVSHNMDEIWKESAKATTDERTLAALTSLIAFCNSMSGYSVITPLLVSSAPDTLGEWVLSLAGKHAFSLPDLRRNSIGSKNPPGVSHKPGLRIVSSAKTAEKASNWELFLRRAGMNPFAALTTLSIMRRHERRERAGSGVLRDDFVYSPDKRKRRVRSLSKFIEMPSDQRQDLLGGIVGPRVLKRVADVVEQDWQCDWALDFFNK